MILKAADPTALEAARAKGGGGAGAGGGGGTVDDAFGAIAASMLARGNNEVVLLNALTRGAGEDTIRQTLAFHGNHPGYVPKAASGRRGPPPGTGSTVPDTHKTLQRKWADLVASGAAGTSRRSRSAGGAMPALPLRKPRRRRGKEGGGAVPRI